MVIWVISLLVVYMLFLILLEPLLNKRVMKGNYQEHTNEDVSEGVTMSLLDHVEDDHNDDEPSSSRSFSARHRENRLPSGYEASAANDDDDVSRYGTSDDDDDSNRSISLFDAKDDVTLGANDTGALAGSGLSGMSSAAGSAAGDNLAASVAVDNHAPLASGSHPMGARGNVLNRVGHQQDKWKRQVREQRKNIYDRHTMLN